MCPFNTQDLEFTGNFITTTTANADLELDGTKMYVTGPGTNYKSNRIPNFVLTGRNKPQEVLLSH